MLRLKAIHESHFFQQPLPQQQQQPPQQQLPQRQPPPQQLPPPQPLPPQPPPQLHVWIYGRLQNAKRKRRLVNAILHALRMIASRPRQNVKRNARFARPNMHHFKMLSSLITSRNEIGIYITFLLVIM